MNRRLVSIATAIALVAVAGLASADVITGPVSKQAVATFRAAAKAAARPYLKSVKGRYSRPSLSVAATSVQRNAIGGLEGQVEVRAPGGWAGTRVTHETAQFMLAPGQSRARQISAWSRRVFATGAAR